MSVYVDNAMIPYGRMVMCHMIADSREELLATAKQIGVAPRWLQKPGTWQEHFDVCKEARAKAVANGAIEVTSRELVRRMRDKQP